MSSSIFLKPTSHDEIHDILSNQNDGCNEHIIDAIFAKYVTSIIHSTLAHVINLAHLAYWSN